MPFFSGLAQGFSEAQTQDRQLQAQRDEAAAQRENSVLQLIASQHSDPEVRASALATMMTPRTGGKSGMGRFFNEAQKNPMLPTLQALMKSGKPQVAEPGPSQMAEPPAALAAATPPPGSDALPAGSPIEPGGPPLSMAAVHNQLPQPAGVTATVPRGGLFTPAEVKGQEAEATARGHIVGTLQGADTAFGGGSLSGTGDPNHDAALKSLVKAHALGLNPVHSYNAAGDLVVSLGDQVVATIPNAGKPMAVESQIESQARNLFVQAQGSAQPITMDEARTQARSAAATATTAKQATTESRATTAAATAAVAPEMAQTRMASLRQRMVNQVAALPGIQMGAEQKRRALNGQLTAAEAAHTAATFLANRPGATSDDFNEMVAALSGGTAGSTPTAPAATPPPAAAQPVVAGDVPVPTATPPPAAAAAATPAAKPGLPPGKSLYKPNAQEQGSLDTIEAAKPMMQRVRGLLKGHETENTWGNTFQGVKAEVQSAVGHNPSNPMYAQLDPLIQHLKVFALGPYLHGIRNGAFVKSVSDNTPTLTDTPARIIQKLDNLEQNFADIEAAVGSIKPKAGGAPPGAVPATPGPEWQMVNGVLHHNGKPY